MPVQPVGIVDAGGWSIEPDRVYDGLRDNEVL
jgi:hypothetical protein